MNRLIRFWSMGLTLVMSVPLVHASDSALQLLEQMQSSARDLVYEGKVVYRQDSNLTTFRITHSTVNGSKESVVYLDPKTGLDIEDDTSIETKSFSLSSYSKLQPQSQQAYSFDLGAKEWVANIECQVVVARPKDAMRYLQRYCIDPSTGMLLKYSLMDRNKQVVEQLMFTDINIETTSSDMSVSPNLESTVTHDVATPTPAPAPPPLVAKVASPASPADSDEWTFSRLPLGFKKVREIKQSATRTQIVVSDGMTSVSIFADNTLEGEQLADKSSYSSGAMNILTREVDDYIITLMGEVPELTLEAILNGLKHTPKP